MTLRLMKLTAQNAKEMLNAGVSADALTDAIAVGALFSIVTRYCDALDFTLPTANEFDRAAGMLLKRGYRSWSADVACLGPPPLTFGRR